MTIKETIAAADALRGTHLRRHSPSTVRDLLSPIIRRYQFLTITRSSGQVWYRARKCIASKPFDNLRDLIYKPESAGQNRANLSGNVALYCSWNTSTAFDEIRAQTGDFVQTIALRVKEGCEFPCHIIGEFACIFNSGGSLINSRKLEKLVNQMTEKWSRDRLNEQLYVDSFLAEQFRPRASEPTDYPLTAVLASDLIDKYNIGIMYPSVQTSHSVNLAVSKVAFDSYFEVVGASVCKVDNSYGYGVYEATHVCQSIDFSSDESIDWQSDRSVSVQRSLQMGIRLEPNVRGWRVPDQDMP